MSLEAWDRGSGIVGGGSVRGNPSLKVSWKSKLVLGLNHVNQVSGLYPIVVQSNKKKDSVGSECNSCETFRPKWMGVGD